MPAAYHRAVKAAARLLADATGAPYQRMLTALRDGRGDLLTDDELRLDAGALAGMAAQLAEGWPGPARPSHVVALLGAVVGRDVTCEPHGVTLWDERTEAVAQADDWSRVDLYRPGAAEEQVTVATGVAADCPDPARVAGALLAATAPSGGERLRVWLPEPVVARLARLAGTRRMLSVFGPARSPLSITLSDGEDSVLWEVDPERAGVMARELARLGPAAVTADRVAIRTVRARDQEAVAVELDSDSATLRIAAPTCEVCQQAIEADDDWWAGGERPWCGACCRRTDVAACEVCGGVAQMEVDGHRNSCAYWCGDCHDPADPDVVCDLHDNACVTGPA